MPTYQYACTESNCGERFELIQAFTDPSADKCTSCGGVARKVFSPVGVVFKGSGFYRTDSRNTTSATASATPGTNQEGSGGKTEGGDTPSTASKASSADSGAGASSTSSTDGAKSAAKSTPATKPKATASTSE